ncbi:hypothetical protein [Haloarchaeobius sp. HRN-SO-5]|uniref:hypothetical protein n=1 Tax=Haloarchaeobius sp. HRN-SO-5 TaxID=3446118 RepID=UPI003EC0FC50
MSVTRQLFEVLVASVLGIVGILVTSAVAPSLTQTMGVLLACAYYFSRYPYGARDGDEINERIDAFYDRYLPF